jgi:hypothetical protein
MGPLRPWLVLIGAPRRPGSVGTPNAGRTPLSASQSSCPLGRAIMFDVAEEAWSNDWAWGLSLIVLTVLVHALALVEIRDRVVLQLPLVLHARRSSMVLALLIVVTVLLLTVLHAVEAAAWAGAYVALGARPDIASAMLYSLSAMTSYGHADVFLAKHWQLMGAIEALNGMMLFGLSTAFLFAVLREHWPTRLRR